MTSLQLSGQAKSDAALGLVDLSQYALELEWRRFSFDVKKNQQDENLKSLETKIYSLKSQLTT